MLVNQNSGFVVILMATGPKPSIRKEVQRKERQGICLECDKPAAEGSRGLCTTHYNRWYRTVCSLDRIAKGQKIEKDIRNGKILDSKQGQRPEQKAS